MNPHLSGAGRLLKDVRGSVLVEYVALIGVVGLVVAAALVQIGPSILNRYQPTRNTLTAPVP
jgi:Flp pilus assembly pilin Flp